MIIEARTTTHAFMPLFLPDIHTDLSCYPDFFSPQDTPGALIYVERGRTWAAERLRWLASRNYEVITVGRITFSTFFYFL